MSPPRRAATEAASTGTQLTNVTWPLVRLEDVQSGRGKAAAATARDVVHQLADDASELLSALPQWRQFAPVRAPGDQRGELRCLVAYLAGDHDQLTMRADVDELGQ